ncbi:MAG: HAD family hydrolase [Candidatus Methanomethylicaceae archaeon]
MKKVLSFDVDGTLVTPLFADTIWLESLPRLVAERHGIPLDKAKSMLYKDYEEIGPNRLEWYDINYWIKRYELNINPMEFIEQHSNLVQLYPEVIEVLEVLKDKFNLIIISNSARIFLNVTTRNIKKYFKNIFSTISDFNKVKNSGVYLDICYYLGISPSQMIHVGDSYELDYLSAIRSGILAYYVDRNNKMSGHYVIKDLRELISKIL